jgi:spore germination cell wall hydrolase CwlJ-like protein
MIDAIEGLFWIALNIYFEAQGEPEEGKIAVAHVTLNRAEQRGLSVKEVVTQKRQFSWYNSRKIPPIKYPLDFQKCVRAAHLAYIQRINGETLRGANHYYKFKGVGSIPPPYWVKSMEFLEHIGDHSFFKG